MIPEWGLFVLFKGLLGEATPRAVLEPQTVEDGNIIDEYFEAPHARRMIVIVRH